MKRDLGSQYMLAIVVNLDDEENNPRNISRVQVRIPPLHGPSDIDQLPEGADPESVVPDEYLPWAQICYPIGTKDPDKHEFFEEGEIVYVTFPKNDTKYPVIIGTLGRMIEE